MILFPSLPFNLKQRLHETGTFSSARQPLAESLVQNLSRCTLSCPLLPLPPRPCSQSYLLLSSSAHHVVMLHLLTRLSLLGPPTEKWEKLSCLSAALLFSVYLHALSLSVPAFHCLTPSPFSFLSLPCFSPCLHPVSSFVLHLSAVALCFDTTRRRLKEFHTCIKKAEHAWFS